MKKIQITKIFSSIKSLCALNRTKKQEEYCSNKKLKTTALSTNELYPLEKSIVDNLSESQIHKSSFKDKKRLLKIRKLLVSLLTGIGGIILSIAIFIYQEAKESINSEKEHAEKIEREKAINNKLSILIEQNTYFSEDITKYVSENIPKEVIIKVLDSILSNKQSVTEDSMKRAFETQIGRYTALKKLVVMSYESLKNYEGDPVEIRKLTKQLDEACNLAQFEKAIDISKQLERLLSHAKKRASILTGQRYIDQMVITVELSLLNKLDASTCEQVLIQCDEIIKESAEIDRVNNNSQLSNSYKDKKASILHEISIRLSNNKYRDDSIMLLREVITNTQNKVNKTLRMINLARLLASRGEDESNAKDHQEALELLELSLNFSKELQEKIGDKEAFRQTFDCHVYKITADILRIQGERTYDLNKLAQALNQLDKSIEISKNITDDLGVYQKVLISKGNLLLRIGMQASDFNILNEANKTYEQALILPSSNSKLKSYQKIRCLNGQGAALLALGHSSLCVDLIEKSEDNFHQCVDIASTHRWEVLRLQAIFNQGNALLGLGEFGNNISHLSNAINLYESLLEHYKEQKSIYNLGSTHRLLAQAFALKGERSNSISEIHHAEKACLIALNLLEKIPKEKAFTQYILSIIYHIKGKKTNNVEYIEKAEQYISLASKQHSLQESPRVGGYIELEYARILCSKGIKQSNCDLLLSALKKLEAVQATAKDTGNTKLLALTQQAQGKVLYELGSIQNSSQILESSVEQNLQALAKFSEKNTPWYWINTQKCLGDALLALGELTGNQEKLLEAQKIYDSISSDIVLDDTPR